VVGGAEGAGGGGDVVVVATDGDGKVVQAGFALSAGDLDEGIVADDLFARRDDHALADIVIEVAKASVRDGRRELPFLAEDTRFGIPARLHLHDCRCVPRGLVVKFASDSDVHCSSFLSGMAARIGPASSAILAIALQITLYCIIHDGYCWRNLPG
jgi:hypothetical protein